MLGYAFGLRTHAEIIEAPSNQTVPVNTITSFFCRARGSNTHWNINGSLVKLPDDGQKFAQKGITFIETPESNDNNVYNMTITVNVSVSINTTTFVCIATGHPHSTSEPAELIVMGKSWCYL